MLYFLVRRMMTGSKGVNVKTATCDKVAVEILLTVVCSLGSDH